MGIERVLTRNTKLNLSDLVQEAAGSLPDGWEVSLRVERDAGWVELIDPDGNEVPFPTNNESIEETYLDAVRHARDR